MEILNDGLRSVARNLRTVLLGAALVVLVGGAYGFASIYALHALYPEWVEAAEQLAAAKAASASGDTTNTAELATIPTLGPPPLAYGAVDLAIKLLYAAAISVLYAVLFATLGRAIDRPLWKCEVPIEAVRRFFMPWFILNLVMTLLINVQGNASSRDVSDAIEILQFLLGPFIIPLGACVMHRGALNWEEIGPTLAPIGRQLRLFIAVLWLGMLLYFFQQIAAELLPGGPDALAQRVVAAALADIPIWLIEAVIFCMAWRICMLDRDAGPATADDLDE